ncbi:Leucine-rich repeat-containing protein 7 [Fukomys damarensis]|uniref:Leucine-rich repeat-containing protein 7 n=1 Tax=Fukomys damarensis TaxID=885580 RepID=A0A091CZB5_FUKDA|nr:Leucine-rich repeat-containing protein 7 [Fukomys damarensis]
MWPSEGSGLSSLVVVCVVVISCNFVFCSTLVQCLEMNTKRKIIGRLVPCRCFRGEEEIISVLDYSHCSLQQVPKEVFNFERTLEELYLDANQIEELPKWVLCGSLQQVPAQGPQAPPAQSLHLAPPCLLSLAHSCAAACPDSSDGQSSGIQDREGHSPSYHQAGKPRLNLLIFPLPAFDVSGSTTAHSGLPLAPDSMCLLGCPFCLSPPPGMVFLTQLLLPSRSLSVSPSPWCPGLGTLPLMNISDSRPHVPEGELLSQS